MIAIPLDRLTPDLLDAVIDAFVLREGTDYGEREFSLDEKRAHVRAALRRGEVTVCFDEATESTTIVPTAELPPEARLAAPGHSRAGGGR